MVGFGAAKLVGPPSNCDRTADGLMAKERKILSDLINTKFDQIITEGPVPTARVLSGSPSPGGDVTVYV